jgi:hypothetical protein
MDFLHVEETIFSWWSVSTLPYVVAGSLRGKYA